MIRFVLLVQAGIPIGLGIALARDFVSVAACLMTSVLLIFFAWHAPDSSRPEKALERRLGQLRIVGREEER